MIRFLIIPLVFLQLGCGLYIVDDKETSYESMLEFGLNQIDSFNPLIVEDKEDHLSYYHVVGDVDYTTWVQRDFIKHNNVNIDTFISNRGKAVLLIPSY